MNTHEPTIAAAQRQSGNTDLGIRPTRYRQTEGLRCAVEFAPQHSALGLRAVGRCIDFDCLHEREVDHKSIIADRCTGTTVSASPHCNEKLVLAGKRNATTTSFSSAQNATKEGRRSIRPFQTFRAASYLVSSGETS